ncbi:hypothetical protein HDU98_009030, partial [Podochytrium sp. JEL0797]
MSPSLSASLRAREVRGLLHPVRPGFRAPNPAWSLLATNFYSRPADRIVCTANTYACAYNFESNDGKYLAIGSENGRVSVLDTTQSADNE